MSRTSPETETVPDIAERLRTEAFDAVDWNGWTMKQWDKIRELAARRDGGDLPRLMFESLVGNLAEVMTEGAAEIERLRGLAQCPGLLVWEPEAKPDASCHYDHTSAATPFGAYRIEWKSWKDYPQYLIEFEGHFVSIESDLSDAKDIAQDDFNKRLRACSAPSPDTSTLQTNREGK